MEVKRTEQKFILNYKESLLLRRKLDAIMPKDVYCTNSEGYDVRSLYFDTVTDKCCA
ncbi:MAG: VTC domain-containing protein, partial [Christensenellales bacterium]